MSGTTYDFTNAHTKTATHTKWQHMYKVVNSMIGILHNVTHTKILNRMKMCK